MKGQYRWALGCLLVMMSWAAAQPGGEAGALLDEARSLAAQARQAYAGTVFHIDQPLWARAVRTAEAALELAPGSSEVLRFLAETYNEVRWDIRAWNHWRRYLEAGGVLDEGAAAGLAEAGTELGFARYRVGDMQGALEYYRQVHALLPDDREALTWLGRIHFELGQPQASLPYWQRLAELEPGDEGARYYLDRVRRQLQVGVAAERAFAEGLAAYEAGNKEAALAGFSRAARLNAEFREALAWAGRVSLELGRSEEARSYWQRVLALEPGDERAAYFLQRAEAQLTWGAEAVLAFDEGLELYEAGELGPAALRFEAAVNANPAYKEAVMWAARAFQELGDAQKAVRYWEQAVALDPADTRAAYFLELARDQVAYGSAATSAFSQGLSSYQEYRFDEAKAFFRQATEANPGYAEAWGWLGRIHFEAAEYALAAEYYERALALDEGNEAYAFFAREARRLAPQPAPATRR